MRIHILFKFCWCDFRMLRSWHPIKAHNEVSTLLPYMLILFTPFWWSFLPIYQNKWDGFAVAMLMTSVRMLSSFSCVVLSAVLLSCLGNESARVSPVVLDSESDVDGGWVSLDGCCCCSCCCCWFASVTGGGGGLDKKSQSSWFSMFISGSVVLGGWSMVDVCVCV